MNPSAEDFVSAIKAANADTVYILPNNSNILMAASQACDIVSDEDVEAFVIPSKTANIFPFSLPLTSII